MRDGIQRRGSGRTARSLVARSSKLSADYGCVPAFAAAIVMASSAVAMTVPVGLALADASALPAGYL